MKKAVFVLVSLTLAFAFVGVFSFHVEPPQAENRSVVEAHRCLTSTDTKRALGSSECDQVLFMSTRNASLTKFLERSSYVDEKN